MSNNKKKSIWLSFDLGIRGNYTGLFTFLDNYKAIDCGNNLAYFLYDNKELLSSNFVIDKLEKELEEFIKPSINDRIYVIWRNDEDGKSTVKGKFLFGNRKTPVWNGYSNLMNKGVNEDEAM